MEQEDVDEALLNDSDLCDLSLEKEIQTAKADFECDYRSSSAMSIAHSLPVDLLVAIFLHNLPSVVRTSSKFMHELCSCNLPWSVAPVNLALVCRAWSEATRGTPSLWSAIHIEQIDQASLCPRVLAFLKVWLRNSASAPLDITLRIRYADDSLLDDEVLDLVFAHNERWRNVAISVNCTSQLSCRVPLRPIALSTFALSFPGAGASYYTAFLPSMSLDLSLSAHTITALEITDVGWLSFKPRGSLQLPNLLKLTLRLSNAVVEDFCDLLTACPNLTNLWIQSGSGVHPILRVSPLEQPDDGRDVQVTQLPSITKLNVEGRKPCVQNLLSRISCPQLRYFDVYCALTNNEANLTGDLLVSLSRFLQQAGPLHSLVMTCSEHFTEPLILRRNSRTLSELLRSQHELKSLHLARIPIDNDTVKEFSATPSDVDTGIPQGVRRLLCPSLEYLTIVVNAHSPLKPDVVEEMVVSRWNSSVVRTLEYVKIRSPGLGDFLRKSERVEACTKEGLRVDISAKLY